MQETAARRLSRMFQLIAFSIKEEKERLSDLDGAIGDADHGITMALGFSAVTGALAKADLEQTLPSEIFAIAASAFLDAVGASTGPLYASAFRSASKALKAHETLDTEGQVAIIEAMTQGIQDRGKGQRGDKTMLDAWIPAAEAAEKRGRPVFPARKCGPGYSMRRKRARIRPAPWSQPEAAPRDWESVRSGISIRGGFRHYNPECHAG